MKILVHIHTWNDADSIDTIIRSVLAQTYPVRDILVVDNASEDATLERTFPSSVTVVRHTRNLGTSGAVRTGLTYAMERGYDWLWILDSDSVPRPGALQKLVDLYEEVRGQGREIGLLSSSHYLSGLDRIIHGRTLTPGGPRLPRTSQAATYVEANGLIWSGSLISTSAVEDVGLPRAGDEGCWQDLSLDYGDMEYSYRLSHAGYRVLVHKESFLDHPVGRALKGKFLGLTIYSTNHAASRRYLLFRNLVYFWLKIYPRRNWPMLMIWFLCRLGVIVLGIVLLEDERGLKLRACLQGIRDGVLGRLQERFG